MNLLLKFSTIFLGAAAIVSCGNSTASGEPIVNKESEEKVLDRVNLLIQEKKECLEQKNRLLHESCFEAPLSWSKKDYAWDPEGQTVLIMERENPTILTLGRYRHRMRDILEISDHGTYSTTAKQEVTVSKGFAEISEISGHLKPYIPAERFSKVSNEIYKAFAADLEKLEGGHSSVSVSIIGEYTPSTSLVIAPPPLAPAEILCKKDWAEFDTYINNASASLAAKVRENSVSVINISGGDDRRTAAALFKYLCPGLSVTREDEDRYLDIVKKFYFNLETLAGVVVVQSAVGNGNRPEDFPIDCPTKNPSNRLRIGFLLDGKNTSIPEEGAALHQGYENLLTDPSRPDHPCIDAYFNSGISYGGTLNRHSLRSSVGFSFERIQLMTTSWIAPLATAAIVSAKKTSLQGLSGAEIVKSILKPGYPAVHDPLGNKSLEAFKEHIFEDTP